ncbi:MAG: MBL fold metallo-hydrolase, partial [Candidatus Eremiobacteraeota bacterium]|nr:MBL fold metallo-hydrolase [Candidatus Eremiobacteraeota bacterium]
TRFLPGFSVFPGGVCETGESTREAARRELSEETGIELPEGFPLRPFTRAITPAYSKYRYDVEVFLAELPVELEPEPDGAEFVSGGWYTASEALKARACGEIQLAPPTYRQLEMWRSCQESKAWPDAQEAFADPPPRNEQVLPFAPGLTIIPLRTRAMPPAAWTNCILLGHRRLFIIDPGGPEVEVLMEEVGALISAGAKVEGIILSHHHPDHIDGYHALKMPELPLYCHPSTRPLLPQDFPSTVDLQDGEKLQVEKDLTLICHFTPGHAPGHLAFELPERKTILAGDMLSSLSSIVLPADNGSLGDYIESLGKLRKLEANLVVPSHGPPWGRGSDPFGDTLKHRQKREEQIFALLGEEPRTVESVAARLYRGLDPRLVPAAQANVRHHLLKLLSDGKVFESAPGWRVRTPDGEQE